MRGCTWIVRLNPFEMEDFGIFLGCRNHLDPKLLHSALYQVLVKTGISRPKDGDAVYRVSHPPPNGPNTQFLADHFGSFSGVLGPYALNFQEKRLTLEKFVQWQRVALIHSVLPPDSLKRPAEIRSAVATV